MGNIKHKKVLIIGSSGAGKSTLSTKLSKKWNLPLVHLDALYWKPGWIPTSKQEFQEKILAELTADEWIIDGNFNSSLPLRAQYADLIIFLDFPKLLCMYRVVTRAWKYRGKTRPDMGPGCNEKMDMEFARWVWRFPKNVRPGLLAVLRETKNVDICILRNPKEVEAFLETAPKVSTKEN